MRQFRGPTCQLKPKYEKSFTPNPLFGSKIREHIYVWNGWLDLGKKFKTSARSRLSFTDIGIKFCELL